MSYLLNIEGIDVKEVQNGGSSRDKAINIVDRFMNTTYFDLFYDRWFTTSEVFTKNKLEKIFNPLNYMSKIVNELVLLSPNMDTFNTSVKKKLNVLNEFKERINWDTLLPQIIKTQETKGDFFMTWFYDEDGKIDIRVLESEDIVDIAMNPSRTKPIAYSHKKTYIDETMSETTGTIQSNAYEVTTVFKKGYIRVNDARKYEKGYKIIENKDWEKDIIRLIHIPSVKDVNKKFSKIPAVDYIDSILLMDAINTDLRMINKLLGFPIKFLIDGDAKDESRWGAGGLVKIESSNPSAKQAKLETSEISNALETIIKERDIVNQDLFKKAGLIREELEESMSGGGNSRVLAQLRLTLENKFEKYYRHIAKGFAPLFESVLRNNDAWAETRDEYITFELPDLFVNTSIFDELQIINSKMALGQTTIQEELRKRGFNQERINTFIEELQQEQALGKDDVDIKKEDVSIAVNGQSSVSDTTDNQFKQEHNLGG